MLSRGRFQTTSTDQYEVQDPVWDEYIYIYSFRCVFAWLVLNQAGIKIQYSVRFRTKNIVAGSF